MEHLSQKSKQLIARLPTYTLLGIIENLAYSLANQSEFFAPFIIRSARTFIEEINNLEPHQKLELIKEITAKVEL